MQYTRLNGFMLRTESLLKKGIFFQTDIALPAWSLRQENKRALMWISINHTDRLPQRQEEGIENLCCKCTVCPYKSHPCKDHVGSITTPANCSQWTHYLPWTSHQKSPCHLPQAAPRVMCVPFTPDLPLPFAFEATAEKGRNPRRCKSTWMEGVTSVQEHHSFLPFSSLH